MGKNDERKCQRVLRFYGQGIQSDGSIPEDGLRLVVDQAREATKSSREVLPTEVADLTILRQAQKELGIQTR